MSAIINTIFILMQASVIFTALPPIEKCQLGDSSCLKKSAQNALSTFVAGIPEVGTESLDPMTVNTIKIDLAGLKLSLRDVDIKGLKAAHIDKLSFDTAKKQMDLTFTVDIVLKSKYKASGRLLILPISGDGDVTIKIKHLTVQVHMPYDIVQDSNGKEAIELKSYKYTYDITGNIHFRLTNLFEGNKQLSDAMHSFMNENWKAISQEFGNPMLDQPMAKIYTSVKAYLKSQPLEVITNA